MMRRRRKRRFRFEPMWTGDGECEYIIMKEWRKCSGSSGALKVSNGIAYCSGGLAARNKSHFGEIDKESNELIERIELLEKYKDRRGNIALLRQAKEQLNEVLACKEAVWQQRSRAVWLRDNDRNTEFSIK